MNKGIHNLRNDLMTIFSRLGLFQLPRILGLIDRDLKSNTFGCCDRHYWHYRVVDFPNSRLQEAALLMTLAFQLNNPQNKFFGSVLLKDWIIAVMDFWARRRHGDGSTDESYPYERHFCSTAFSLYAMTESLLLLGEKPRWDLSTTAHFLMRHDNLDVANQMACAAAALNNIFLLTHEDHYRLGFESKLAALLKMQNETGAFNEYGGFDCGYDSITLGFLADISKKTGRGDVAKAAVACVDNARRYLDEDGYFSPHLMSRRTQFLFPYGFSVFAPDILGRLERGLSKEVILQPAWMDDRYCIPFATNYMKTV